MRRRTVIALVCATAMLSGLVSAAAVTSLRAGSGPTGKSVSLVKVVRAGTAINGSPTTFENIPGSVTTNISVPSGTKAFILVRFTAESACDGGVSGNDWCSVRILVDGVEAKPASAENYAFDSTNDGGDGDSSWEGHALERTTDVLNAGTYTVTAQWYVTDAATNFRLDDINMTVERVKV
jgi:hypothetical protein